MIMCYDTILIKLNVWRLIKNEFMQKYTELLDMWAESISLK
jgi:hypothetical protein